ncbi:MAG: hypothetical protein ABJL99_10145 [Aliishimia sp.]
MAAGSISVTLGGASYNMKPAYLSMRDIEDRTGLTISELLELVVAQRLKIEEATLVVWYACQAAGEDFSSVESVGGAIFEERLSSPSLQASLSKFFLACLYAPKDAKKKFDEEVAPIINQTEAG